MNTEPSSKRCLTRRVSRRAFIGGTAAAGLCLRAGLSRGASGPEGPRHEPLAPVGVARGIHPGRVVWVRDPEVLDWSGPEAGPWYGGDHLRQARVDGMMSYAVRQLSGASTLSEAWDHLFQHHNRTRGHGGRGYAAGEKVLIKPNWVGMIWREGAVDPATYTLVKRRDYMNTAPQMIVALIRQLVDEVGVRPADITVCDSLAYLVNEYHAVLARAFPEVQYVDFAGQFGRRQVQRSDVPLYWSCRPEDVRQDFLPTCIAEAAYLVNFATLKAHSATGVTLCGKNHFGSLVRWPVEKGYYDLHRHSFAKVEGRYREQVDLLGHAHLGGKTVLNLVDGLFCGIHPIDAGPRRLRGVPFAGDWSKSLLASQDPVAIDSVGLDFLRAEYDDHPWRTGTDDYLHEAALAANPPSGTVYDPHHPQPEERLASLGVHEHWNNAVDKKYSRNLGTGEGIELVAVSMEGAV